jgi:hypothetical protein
VGRVLAQKPEFDFADVKDVNDPRFLPGGAKYGGWGAFAALASPDDVWLVGKGDAPQVIAAAYRTAGAEARLRILQPDLSAVWGAAPDRGSPAAARLEEAKKTVSGLLKELIR